MANGGTFAGAAGSFSIVLPATQVMPYAPWQIPVTALETEGVRIGVRDVVDRRPGRSTPARTSTDVADDQSHLNARIASRRNARRAGTYAAEIEIIRYIAPAVASVGRSI